MYIPSRFCPSGKRPPIIRQAGIDNGFGHL
jgi:hypothetical protein